MQLGGLPVSTDVSAGTWIAGAIGSSGVAALLPPVFAGYARVLHPAVRYAGDDDVDVAWAEVADANSTLAHRLMQWAGITGSWDFLGEDNQSPLWDDAPAEGHLPVAVAARLVDVLAAHTATPDDCWFALSTDLGTIAVEAPTLVLPDREFWLARGPVTQAVANLAPEPLEQSANLWWPADRAWCVVTDIDLMSTYVGGSAACIAAVLAAPGLEAFPATPTDPTTRASDPVNPVIG